jgi:2-dehydropantoate 2-reductase
MRIAVMGSGGIGGYFGSQLARVDGHDVWFVARGAHLAAMRSNGLTIRHSTGDTTVTPVQATNDPSTIGPVDIVIFAVKLYDVDAAIESCRPLVGDSTGVVSLQNGIGTEERIDEILGEGHAIGGIAYAPLALEAPGIIRHEGDFARITIGEMSGSRSSRLDEFLTACQQAGIEVEASANIEKDLWDKFVFLASFAGITCLTRQPCRVLQDDEKAFELFVASLKEAVAVAAAEGVSLDEGIIERYSGFVRKMAPDAQSSMLTDLQAGKPLENEWFAGKIVELGQQHKIPTPINQAYFVSMRPYQAGGT